MEVNIGMVMMVWVGLTDIVLKPAFLFMGILFFSRYRY